MAADLFFSRTGMDRTCVQGLVDTALHGTDDGELYLEHCRSESFSFDDGRLKAASFDTTQGFGLRCICGETVGFAHAVELSEDAVKRAATAVRAAAHGFSGEMSLPPERTNRTLYAPADPVESAPFAAKIKLMEEMNAYARAKDVRVRQVFCMLSGSRREIEILRAGGESYGDIRPLVLLYVSVVVEENGRQETGSHGGGGRFGYDAIIAPDYWRGAVDEALRQALVNLESIPAPAGEMSVVLGSGWPGILLHEAVGHGLEGDFNRKKTSVFSGRIGEQVAAKGVTVIDDGTIENRRGTLSIDDEGTPTSRTVLIEDGILKGYMQDRQNARLMGMAPTGNGRRQSYGCKVMPRMTNTFMLAGDHPPEEILASVKRGIYAVQFGGGQVDITSGKFVFSCTEAYLIEDGKIGAPIKGATLIGSGLDAMNKVTMIGTDMKLDSGIGTCGKDGQSVPVGVGQPTIRIDGLTVGGTAA
jgi:TldD protein